MPGPWDDLMKHLVRTKPEHLVMWVLERAQFKERLSDELKVTLYMDGLFRIEQDEQPMLVNVEFQSKADTRMGERLQEYNVFASKQNNYLPVFSCVIYLRKNINVAPSPLIRRLPGGTQNHRFDFAEIELAAIPAEQLLKTGLLGVFPLSLLAKDGTQPEVVDTITTTLADAGEKDLLAIAYTLGGLVFTTAAAKEWYKRRFRMFEDMIRDNWVYQEITQEGFDKGIEQGREQGIREGELQALREAILDIVHERFPEVEALSKKQIETIKMPKVLRRLIVEMSKATTIVEAGSLVLALRDSENGQ